MALDTTDPYRHGMLVRNHRVHETYDRFVLIGTNFQIRGHGLAAAYRGIEAAYSHNK
ncbi:hypothetical protein ACRYGU_23835 [Mycobacteroides abscessus]